MATAKMANGSTVLLASCLLSAVLGTVHGFSVFIEPLEARFTANRSTISLTYSLALASLTAAVLMGHRLFSKVSAAKIVLGAASLAAVGLLVAATAKNIVGLWLGFGVIFGAANGLGYGYGLQVSAQANPGREGMAMGLVTAAYAVGATIAPIGFLALMGRGGVPLALIGLAVCLIGLAPICTVLMHRSGVGFQAVPAQGDAPSVSARLTVILWVGYGAGVAAGLMAIGHAAGIAKSFAQTGPIWIAPVLIAICNMGGSFSGGWLKDKIGYGGLLICLPILTALGLITLVTQSSILIGLGLVGLAYGATIAVYPAAIAEIAGAAASTRVYGRVFTAWGFAGLAAPWLAGYLFDLNKSYEIALWTACGFAILSSLAAWRLVGMVR